MLNFQKQYEKITRKYETILNKNKKKGNNEKIRELILFEFDSRTCTNKDKLRLNNNSIESWWKTKLLPS